MRRLRGRVPASRLLRLLLRATVAAVVLWILLSLPLPIYTPQFWFMVRLPLAVFLFVLYIGKLLYDTFFYDHYPH